MTVMFYPFKFTQRIGSNFLGVKRCNIRVVMGDIEG